MSDSSDADEDECHSRASSSRSSYVNWREQAQQGGLSLAGVRFPKGWEIPDESDFKENFTKVSYSEAAQRLSSDKFKGTREDYVRWRNLFWHDIHVQQRPISLKLQALNNSVEDHVKESFFQGLCATAQDYATRLKRLEQRFGGEKHQEQYYLDRLSALYSKKGTDLDTLRDYVFAIEGYVNAVGK